jgi:septum formation protein
MNTPFLVLASASSRRRDILTSLGAEFDVQEADVDETRLANESGPEMVLRLARCKAETVARRLPPGTLVLGADTAVLLDGHIFGKPESGDEALAMLAALSGRTHTVLTGVALVARAGLLDAVSRTEVRFREIDPDEARHYWQSGEPRGKAGAYAIQGLGASFVEHIEGSFSGVVGLPVFETMALLRQAGYDLLQDARNQS